MKKSRLLLIYLVLFFSIFILKLPRFIEINFGDISLEQLFFHVLAEHNGIPKAFIFSLYKKLILQPFIYSTLVLILIWAINKYLPSIYYKASKGVLICALIYMQIYGLFGIYYVLNVDNYLQANFYGRQNAKVDWMKEYYKQPSVNFDKNHKPKNLIIIYVESLDNFRVKSDSILRRELNSLAVRHFSIQPGTQWTLAGIIASQCGVPILPVGLIASHGLMETREPLKNAVCLGDILSKEGYYIEFIGGANPEFAGKGNFLKKHGFNNVSGKSELNTLFPESKYPSDWWGHSDEVVLKHAKNRVAKLAKLNQPYFLNILTLDTHANAGNFFEYCEKQGHTNTIDQIFECSVKQVEEFYLWLYKNNYLENTVLIVMGDHPFMSRDFRKKIGGSKFRSLSEKEIFFGIKLPNDQKVTLESMTHFDIYPTTLSALGFELDNNAAGIGKNMLSKNFNNMSAKHKDLPNQLRRNSPDYLNLWRDQPN